MLLITQLKHCILVALAIMLTACTSIPLTSLPRLMGLDMDTIDPAAIEVAVRLQNGLALPPEGVTLFYELNNTETGEEIGGDFPMVPLDEPLTPFLKRKATRDRTVLRFRLDEEQAARMREVRETALGWKDTCDGNCSISFAVNTKPCVEEGTNPFRELKFSVYLKTDQERDFFTLFNNRSVEFDSSSDDLPRCEAGDES